MDWTSFMFMVCLILLVGVLIGYGVTTAYCLIDLNPGHDDDEIIKQNNMNNKTTKLILPTR